MQISGNQQHAGLSEIFQFRIQNPDRGGKPLAVGGSMIALVERGREMPSPIRLFTGNLAQRNLLSFPPGLRVERGDFSCNIAGDFPKSDSKSYFPLSHPELCVSQGINSTLDLANFFNFESQTRTVGANFLPWAAL